MPGASPGVAAFTHLPSLDNSRTPAPRKRGGAPTATSISRAAAALRAIGLLSLAR